MNILTFDIEEWYIEKKYHGSRNEKFKEFDRILNNILLELSIQKLTATFFCLGKIAQEFPEIIKKISEHGHEIGSHSNAHIWVNKMTEQEFREDTKIAVDSLEQLTGTKIKSFRAPAFSIGESNKWAMEVLTEYGIENDASIFPGVRDFGGFPNFTEQKPCVIEYNGIKINEFPIPLLSLPLIGKEIAYSGGGYFRLLPISLVKKQMTSSDYNMCYFHIADLLSEKSPMMDRKEFETYFKESGPFMKRLIRYLKSNVGRNKAWNNLDSLLSTFKFTSIEGYLSDNSIEKVIKI